MTSGKKEQRLKSSLQGDKRPLRMMKIPHTTMYVILLLSINDVANSSSNHFTDVTVEAGIDFIHTNGAEGDYHFPETLGSGGGFIDYDDDGDLDLYLVNSGHWPDSLHFGTTTSALYQNNGDGMFHPVTLEAGVEHKGNYGHGVACGDYDNDGDPDLYVTNFGDNVLYQNNGDGTFTDVSYKASLGDESYLLLGFGTGFLDDDNDGHLDIFVANGHIFEHVDRMTDVVTYAQENQLFRNTGSGRFSQVPFDSAPHVSRGAIFGDYDNDGDIDIVVTNLNGRAQLWRNDRGNDRNWLAIKVQGTVSNRDGIGTQITVRAGNTAQYREVRTGYSYLCSNDRRIFFGLGDVDVVESLKIRWPSDIIQTLENIQVNQELPIIEGDE